MFDKIIFSQRLLELRKQKGISQAKLAESIGVSFHQISKMEKGERAASIEVMTSLADYFDVPIDYLTGRGLFGKMVQLEEKKDEIIQTAHKWFGGYFDDSFFDMLDKTNPIHRTTMLSMMFEDIVMNDKGDEIALYPLLPKNPKDS